MRLPTPAAGIKAQKYGNTEVVIQGLSFGQLVVVRLVGLSFG
jgi:hypothetical protein